MQKIAQQSEIILIGNSKEEMIHGKKANFRTIFVEREVKGPIDYTNLMDLRIKNLKEIANDLLDKGK